MPVASVAGTEAVPSAACLPEHVELAHRLADVAAAVTTRYFRTPVSVDVKLDASPVTVADREAEAAMREVLGQQCPDHGIFGEEQGYLAGGSSSEYLWVIDPIDGTKSFITGAVVPSKFAVGG
jgi:inositol-phosphate phosphatase/L-galactose 1-phosphate phosphatase/histidinol-phosphatase